MGQSFDDDDDFHVYTDININNDKKKVQQKNTLINTEWVSKSSFVKCLGMQISFFPFHSLHKQTLKNPQDPQLKAVGSPFAIPAQTKKELEVDGS